MLVSPGSALLLVTLALVAACAPQKPSVVPQSVQVTGVGLLGVRLRTDLNAYNPNRFQLTVQEVSGRIVLNDSVPMGAATAPASVVLPGESWQRFAVDLDLPWLNLPAALALAHLQQQVPYTFEGHATVGGKIRLTVPLRMQGSVPAQELLRAGALGGAATAPAPHLLRGEEPWLTAAQTRWAPFKLTM